MPTTVEAKKAKPIVEEAKKESPPPPPEPKEEKKVLKEEVKKIENKEDANEVATFGLGYFFGEECVPVEVEELMENMKTYNDGKH